MRKNLRKIEVEEEEADPREYTATEVCTVVNCAPATLRAWRRRNGLFPDSMLSGGWNYFSLADMATVKLVVDMKAAGYTAQIAVNVAMKMLPIIEERMTKTGAPHEELTREEFMSREWPNYVVRVDRQDKISFDRFDGAVELTKIFDKYGVSGLFIINTSNLTDVQEGLDILSGLRPPRKKSQVKKAKVKAAPKARKSR